MEKFVAWLAATAIDRLAAFKRSARNRRSVAKLLDWDERMLRDIGLTSTDVHSALAVPVGKDPSSHLRVLSTERRAAVRAQARERLALADRVRSKNGALARFARSSLGSAQV